MNTGSSRNIAQRHGSGVANHYTGGTCGLP